MYFWTEYLFNKSLFLKERCLIINVKTFINLLGNMLESYIVYSSVSSTHAAWKTIYVFSLKNLLLLQY